MTSSMPKKREGVNVVFLRQVTGKKTQRLEDGSWQKAAADIVIQDTGTQLLKTYIDKRQETVA